MQKAKILKTAKKATTWLNKYIFLIVLLPVIIVSYNNCDESLSFKLSQGNLSVGRLKPLSTNNEFGIIINSGDEYTRDRMVDLSFIPGENADEMFISFESDCSQGAWEDFKTNELVELNQTNSESTVYVKYRFRGEEEGPCVGDSIVHDDIQPEVEFVNQPQFWTPEENLNIGIEARDSGSGVKQVQCDKQGSGQFEVCGRNVVYSSLVENKNYLLVVRVADRAGNLSRPKQIHWVSDQSPPSLILSLGPVALTADTTPDFIFTPIDTGSGIARLECRQDNQTQFSTCPKEFSLRNLSDGPHILEVKAVDNVGRYSDPVTHSWTQDTTVPTIHFTEKPSPIAKEQTARFQFSEINNNHNITSYECQFDNEAKKTCTSPHLLTDLSEGEHRFSVVGSNTAGQSSSPIIYRWFVDTGKPTLRIVEKPEKLTNSNQALFIFLTQDESSGIEKIQCSLDGETYNTCGSSVSFNDLSEGNHTFMARSLDRAGHFSDVIFYQWTVDRSRPTVTITSKPDNPTNNNRATFGFQGQDDGSGIETIECRFDGNSFETCQEPWSYTGLTDGDHHFSVRAGDRAGNLSLVETYRWFVDTTGPILQFTKKPGLIVSIGETIQIRFNANDEGGNGVENYQCVFNGTNYPCAGDTTYSFQVTTEVSNSFQVTVFDSLGNQRTETLTWRAGTQTTFRQINHRVLEHSPVDILFIVDTSNSMVENRRNLAEKIDGFTEKIENENWQIAVTTTDADYYDREHTRGRLTDFNYTVNNDNDPNNNVPVIRIFDSNVDTDRVEELFANRIQNFLEGTGNEQGIYAMVRVIQRYLDNESPHTQFFRNRAHLAVVILSDENEKSKGINVRYTPSQFLQFVSESFGNKSITWHSIIKTEGDGCPSGEPGTWKYNGTHYQELSRLTNGVVGRICDDDYTTHLKSIGQSVSDAKNEVFLGCIPDTNKAVDVLFKPENSDSYQSYFGTYRIEGQKLIFDNALENGEYRLNFNCSVNID